MTLRCLLNVFIRFEKCLTLVFRMDKELLCQNSSLISSFIYVGSDLIVFDCCSQLSDQLIVALVFGVASIFS